MLKNKLLSASGAAEAALAIEDVFSTYLYTGNGSTQTITNGIDLAGEGGLVWIKSRSVARSHNLFDSERVGVGYKVLFSDTTAAESDPVNRVTAFNADGFTMSASTAVNASAEAYASWTFRKAPRFFDVVTYTGTGSVRTVAHNLGITPGCIIIKETSAARNWYVYHRSTGNTKYLHLNLTDAAATSSLAFNNTDPTDTEFTVGTINGINNSGATYVAYLFAHDPLGPSGDGSDGLIACGSYTGTGATQEISLGWEPQWVMVKRTDSTGDWQMSDIMRGATYDGAGQALLANTSGAEATTYGAGVTPTGFRLTSNLAINNASGGKYIYIAIRRGPMRPPESGTEVFSPNAVNVATGTQITTGFPVDLQIFSLRSGTTNKNNVYDRLRGVSSNTTESGARLITSSTAAETAAGNETLGWDNTGFKMTSVFSGTSDVFWNFRRAPEFFDVVAYQGNNVAGRTVPHNLGVAPEMLVVKSRQIPNPWIIYHKDLGAAYAISFDTSAAYLSTASWNSTAPTDSVFTLGGTGGGTNAATSTFIAYLFASKAGVSKVGSYTGNGTSQTIDCGFTTGARFILVKRTDSTGDWYVWDTARGIVAANDPYLRLNSAAAEVTTNDSVDPASVGFIVNQVAATNINVNAASYIFLAIA